MLTRLTGALALVLTIMAAPALAHTGMGSVDGLVHGLQHPLTGLDHVLAMIAVGLWAGLIGGRARIAYPVAFVSAMALAGLWAMAGGQLPGAEVGIAFSVVILGLAIALNLSPPLAAGALVCGVFAIFHGFAHGAELPEDASGVSYAIGFVIATSALHGVGLLLASQLAVRMPQLARIAGGGLILAGVAILSG
ncbi:HupE/UreJ family protein [Bosea sp. 2KB_26]|uniref:HupE/UreJ family protein n=1 Tax=Bosea sp. 2KB_26 TaxID=3237475 RepID=UPI003F905543